MTKIDAVNRRAFLKSAGLGAGMLASLPSTAFGEGNIAYESVAPSQEIAPTATLNFAGCGMSHDHIYGMVGAIQRGGGKLVAWFGEEPDKIALFKSRFPDIPMAASEQAILEDPKVQLVLSSTVASKRAQPRVRAMKHGQD